MLFDKKHCFVAWGQSRIGWSAPEPAGPFGLPPKGKALAVCRFAYAQGERIDCALNEMVPPVGAPRAAAMSPRRWSHRGFRPRRRPDVAGP